MQAIAIRQIGYCASQLHRMAARSATTYARPARDRNAPSWLGLSAHCLPVCTRTSDDIDGAVRADGDAFELWRAEPVCHPPLTENPMPSTLEALHAEVMRLSQSDRSTLLDRLIASLDVDAGVEAASDQRTDEREQELDAGIAQAMPIEAAIAKLEDRFPG